MDDEGPDTSVWTVGLVVGWWGLLALILAYVPVHRRTTVWAWLHVGLAACGPGCMWAWLHVGLGIGLLIVAPFPSLPALIGLGLMCGLSWGIGHEVLQTAS